MQFSVVIPVRNGASTLARCLRAIELTDDPDVEVVVVNDASTDDTAAIAQRHNCRVLDLKELTGAAGARNRGIAVATGEVLVFVDADVVIPADTFTRIRADLAAHPNAAAVICVYTPVGPNPGFWSRYKHVYLSYSFLCMPQWIGTVQTSLAAVRRDALLAVNGFEESIITSEDDCFGRALVRAGYKILLDKELKIEHLKTYSFTSALRDTFVKSTNLAYHFLRVRQEPPIEGDLPFAHHRAALLISLPTACVILSATLWFALARSPAGLAFLAVATMIYTLLNVPYFRFVSRHHGAAFTLGVALFSVVEMAVAALAVVKGSARFLTRREAEIGWSGTLPRLDASPSSRNRE